MHTNGERPGTQKTDLAHEGSEVRWTYPTCPGTQSSQSKTGEKWMGRRGIASLQTILKRNNYFPTRPKKKKKSEVYHILSTCWGEASDKLFINTASSHLPAACKSRGTGSVRGGPNSGFFVSKYAARMCTSARGIFLVKNQNELK